MYLILTKGSLPISSKLADDILQITRLENSDGSVVTFATHGFGTTLMDRTVTLQLRGSFTRAWTTRRLKVSFSIPLRELG